MRSFYYKHDSDNPTPAMPQTLKALEEAIGNGVRLQVDSEENPNDVHGYANMFSTDDGQGYIEVHLYEPADVKRIEKLPDEAVGGEDTKKWRGIQKIHNIPTARVHEKINSVLSKKGYRVNLLHP